MKQAHSTRGTCYLCRRRIKTGESYLRCPVADTDLEVHTGCHQGHPNLERRRELLATWRGRRQRPSRAKPGAKRGRPYKVNPQPIDRSGRRGPQIAEVSALTKVISMETGEITVISSLTPQQAARIVVAGQTKPRTWTDHGRNGGGHDRRD